MTIRGSTRTLLALLFALVLAACGNDDNNTNEPPTAEDPSPPPGSEPDAEVSYRLGSWDANGFKEGRLSIPLETLTSGGETRIRAEVVNHNDVPYSSPVEVHFTSACTENDTADMESMVTAYGGWAEARYQAKGCNSTDKIIATATIDDKEISASGEIVVKSAEPRTIQFVSATPEVIAPQGLGTESRPEYSKFIFRVLDKAGNPLAHADVSFSLDANADDLILYPASVRSGPDGLVETTVWSGPVIRSAVVSATLNATGASNQSSAIKVGAGLPDQDSFSISADNYNPEGWDYDGVPVDITVRFSDHDRNSAPDGTLVTFKASGGSIDLAGQACQTVDGACTVRWISQNPRPDNGRVIILAYALGEESFEDLDGDRLFGLGEQHHDLPEAFLDLNESGRWDEGEPFIDFDGNGEYSHGDGIYNGSRCATEDACDPDAPQKIHIFDNITLVMSGSTAYIYHPSDVTHPVPENGERITGGTIALSCDPQPVSFTIADINKQTLPAETTIRAMTTYGNITSEQSWSVRSNNASEPQQYYWLMEGEETPGKGLFSIVTTTPKGDVTRYYFTAEQTEACTEDDEG